MKNVLDAFFLNKFDRIPAAANRYYRVDGLKIEEMGMPRR